MQKLSVVVITPAMSSTTIAILLALIDLPGMLMKMLRLIGMAVQIPLAATRRYVGIWRFQVVGPLFGRPLESLVHGSRIESRAVGPTIS